MDIQIFLGTGTDAIGSFYGSSGTRKLISRSNLAVVRGFYHNWRTTKDGKDQNIVMVRIQILVVQF